MRPDYAEFPLVLGGGMVPFGTRSDGTNFRDWTAMAVTNALADAALTPSDIDSVVVASESDFLSLQVNPGSVLVDDLGLSPCPVVRVEAGGAAGAAAVQVAVAQVMARQAKRVLVVGFEQAASGPSSDTVSLTYGLSFDALIDGFTGASAVSLYALSMRLHMANFGTTPAEFATVSVKNHRNAMENPWAHKPMELTVDDVLSSPMISDPYRRLDCCLISDGAAALIVARDEDAPSTARPRSRIIGVGSATDPVRIGDRPDPARFAAKAIAAAKAYQMADISAETVEVAEVYDSFSGAELQAIEALGLRPEGQAAAAMADSAFGPDGQVPINLSGGLIGQGAPNGAVGIAQTLTVDRLLTGRYWPALQPDPAPRVGLTDTHGGVATTCMVNILQRAD